MAKRLLEVLKPDRQKLLAAVHIFENSVVASRFGKDGTVQRRLVTATQLAEIFGGLGEKQVNWMQIDKSTVGCGTDSDGRQRYLIIRGAKQTVINFEFGRRKKKITIHMPKLLAEVVAKQDGSGRQFTSVERVFAFDGKLKKTTQLYVPPVPNMHPNGTICMGSVNTVAIGESSKTPAEFFEKAFIKSTFTDHILDSPLSGQAAKKYRNIIDLLKKNRGRAAFEYLKKVGTYGKIYK